MIKTIVASLACALMLGAPAQARQAQSVAPALSANAADASRTAAADQILLEFFAGTYLLEGAFVAGELPAGALLLVRRDGNSFVIAPIGRGAMPAGVGVQFLTGPNGSALELSRAGERARARRLSR